MISAMDARPDIIVLACEALHQIFDKNHSPLVEQVGWIRLIDVLSTLMQLLFSFDQDMRVDETLMQTHAYQLSCNSCSRLTRTRELMKLSCKLSLANSHATLVLV